ncbi:MAG: SDR family oxidoreductase [Proteobacteria bacterium]|nr:SDR family oxidoreductase [Pseudomonadota bacterium]
MSSGINIRTFNGATAIVTGGASGIGRALAVELAARGCEVVLADRQIDLAREVTDHIGASGGKARAIEIDVTDFSAVEKLVHETARQSGRLDYIFNNAGISIGGLVDRHEIGDWNQIVDVNLLGVIHGTHAAYPIMAEQGFGHIVNTASLAGLIPVPGAASYATTKAAIVSLSRSLRAEAAHRGVRVSALCPGAVRTPMLDGCGKYGKVLGDISPEMLNDFIEKMKPMPADRFAKKVLRGVQKNKTIIIVPSWLRVIWWMDRLFPGLVMFFTQKSFQKLQAKISPDAS